MAKCTGDGPCGNCSWFIDYIELTGKEEPAADGGTLMEIAPGQTCPGCGMELYNLHTPPPGGYYIQLACPKELEEVDPDAKVNDEGRQVEEADVEEMVEVCN